MGQVCYRRLVDLYLICLFAEIGELASLFFSDAGIDDIIHLPLKNGIKAEVAAETVICHPVVFGVVGADFFASIPCAYLGTPSRSFARIRLSQLALIELGAQNL